MIYKEELRDLVISLLLKNPDIISKYNIFYNGSNIIAEYKDLVRLYKELLDRALIFDIIYYFNILNNILIKDTDIFNSSNCNFLIIFEKNNINELYELNNSKLYIISKDILIDDIKNGYIKKPDLTYILTHEYLEDKATRKITIKIL